MHKSMLRIRKMCWQKRTKIIHLGQRQKRKANSTCLRWHFRKIFHNTANPNAFRLAAANDWNASKTPSNSLSSHQLTVLKINLQQIVSDCCPVDYLSSSFFWTVLIYKLLFYESITWLALVLWPWHPLQSSQSLCSLYRRHLGVHRNLLVIACLGK